MKKVVPHYIAKIEGHGSLRIDYTTETAKMNIHEGERLFEAMLLGRSLEDAVFIPQRICGVCPTAHCMSALKALEYAMGVKVTQSTKDLRELMLTGQMIQSHALHLFFLVAPDYLQVDSALSLADTAPEKFQMALNLKKMGDKLVEVVGGRPVHPITPVVGGFTKNPDSSGLEELRSGLDMVLSDAIESVKLFASVDYPELENPTQYASIQSDSRYGFYAGMINTSTGDVFPINDYMLEIDEVVRPYSTAKFAQIRKKPMMVGALARLNLHSIHLNPLASEELEASGVAFPSMNSFHNNLAQAIEMLHFTEEAIKLIDKMLDFGIEDTTPDYEVREGVGTGAVEAPRGTLYYTYGVDSEGKISQCNIITPTVQNLANIESDVEELLSVTKNKKQSTREHLMEMLIRAYDPCITCSVH